MITRLLAIPVLTACLTLGGCGTVLFNDNFDADTPGGPPNETPPGDPVGDAVYLSDITGSSAEVVTGASAGDRDLRYSKQPANSIARFVGFLSKEITPGERAVTASWVAVADIASSDGPLDIWLGNSHFGAIAGFRIEDGRVLRRMDDNEYLDIGAFANDVQHSVVWTIDRDAATYSLLISGLPGGSISVPNEPVIDGAANPYLLTSRATLYLWFSEGGSGTSTYTLDEVRIAETDREV